MSRKIFNKEYFSSIFKLYFLFSFFTTIIAAQDSQHSAFISPVLKFQSVFDRVSYTGGVKFGWVINNRIVIGGGFYSSLNSLLTNFGNSSDNKNVLLSFNMGGLEMEYIFFNSEFNHTSFLFFSGGAGLYYSTPDNNQTNYASESFLVWEPQLYSEINLRSWLRIGMGAGYRFISYTNYLTPKNGEELKGLFGLLVIKFTTK